MRWLRDVWEYEPNVGILKHFHLTHHLFAKAENQISRVLKSVLCKVMPQGKVQTTTRLSKTRLEMPDTLTKVLSKMFVGGAAIQTRVRQCGKAGGEGMEIRGQGR